MKNIILTFIIFMLSVLGISAATLTKEQKIEDFEYLYNMVSQNYPYLWVKERQFGYSWTSMKDKFMQEVESSEDDQAFIKSISRMVNLLQNDHTKVLTYEEVNKYSKKYNSGFYAAVFSSMTLSSYQKYENLKPSSDKKQVPFFEAFYIDGFYKVVSSADEKFIPIGAIITRIDGIDTDSYVLGLGYAVKLKKDFEDKGKLFCYQLPLERKEKVSIEYLFNGKYIQTDINPYTEDYKTVFEDYKPATADSDGNILSEISSDGRQAYLKINSFDYSNIKADKDKLFSFYSGIKNCKTLIIDIRGNSGGADSYWTDLIVSPLANHPYAVNSYIFIRSGTYAQQAAAERFNLAYNFFQASRNEVLGMKNLPPELLSEEFGPPVKIQRLVLPGMDGFDGKIVVVTDKYVYSSSETFAYFCKKTGFAAVVGERTGGDGIGFDPLFFVLPNSRLVVRMTYTYGINPDGTSNEEYRTAPDFFIRIANNETIFSQISNIPKMAIQNWTTEAFTGYFPNNPLSFRALSAGESKLADPIIIDNVKIKGAYRTDINLLEKKVGFKSGDLIDSTLLKELNNNLKLMNSFSEVYAFVKENDLGKYDLIIYVNESSGLFKSSYDMFSTLLSDIVGKSLTLKSYNLFGKMINLSARYSFNKYKSTYLTTTYPSIFFKEMKYDISVGFQSVKLQPTLGELAESNAGLNINFLSYQGSRYYCDNLFAFQAKLMDESITSQNNLSLKDSLYLENTLRTAGYFSSQTYDFSYWLRAGSLTDISNIDSFKDMGEICKKTDYLAEGLIDMKLSHGLFFSHLTMAGGYRTEGTPFEHLFRVDSESWFKGYKGYFMSAGYAAATLRTGVIIFDVLGLYGLIDGGKVFSKWDQAFSLNGIMLDTGFSIILYNPFVDLEFYLAKDIFSDEPLKIAMSISTEY